MMYANLAKTLGALHEPDARRRYQQAVTAFTVAFGADSQLLAEARTEYAGWLVAQGELAAAVEQVEQGLPVLRRSASGDPALGRGRVLLARMLGPGPRYRAPARALAEQAAEVFTAAGLIGGGHPVGATGVRMLLDAHKQVTDSAGDCQISGADRMLTFNLGGSTTTSVCLIVEAGA